MRQQTLFPIYDEATSRRNAPARQRPRTRYVVLTPQGYLHRRREIIRLGLMHKAERQRRTWELGEAKRFGSRARARRLAILEGFQPWELTTIEVSDPPQPKEQSK